MTRTTRLRRFLAARFSPEGEFGLHLTVGAALMLLAAWLFSHVAAEVQSGAGITRLDVQLAHWFHDRASPGFTHFMLAVTHLHSVPGILGMGLVFAAFLYRRGERGWLAAVLLTLPTGMVLNVLLKHAFQRARPQFDDPLLTLSTYSFPSGHTASATILWGLLACWLASGKPRPQSMMILLAALCIVALVGLSRMYLGVHYLSDVLAALAEGVAWLALCITSLTTLRRRRAARARA
jgi:undecaprenyl-diphosphatase